MIINEEFQKSQSLKKFRQILITSEGLALAKL